MGMVKFNIKMSGTLEFDPRDTLENYMEAGDDFTEVYLEGADPDSLTDTELAKAMVKFDLETEPSLVTEEIDWDYDEVELS